MLACYRRAERRFDMDNKGRVRGPNYTDGFKRQLVAESFEAGVTVPIVSKRHNVPTSRIYSWRQDTRFHPLSVAEPDFTAVEVTDAPILEGGGHGRTDIHKRPISKTVSCCKIQRCIVMLLSALILVRQ